MSDLPKTICALPWISIEAGPLGALKPCCMAQDEIVDENGNKYDLNTTTLETVYNSKYMQELRKQFREGVMPATCKRCWDEEKAGKPSKRIYSKPIIGEMYEQIDWYNDEPNQLWFLDLKLGNICNLRCRICSAYASSKWAEEDMDFLPDNKDRTSTVSYSMLKQGAWPRKTQTFWDNLKKLLPNVKYFEFTGGEPWLIKEHVNLLQFAVEQGYSKNIKIHYNTNATQTPSKLAELWTNFKHVDIAFSIDNVGERYEYERYGAQWNVVNDNIDKVHRLRDTQTNISTQLCFTINIQNVYYIDELLQWAETKNFGNIYFNMLHVPSFMCIHFLTPQAKELIINKFNSINWKDCYKRDVNNVIQFINNGAGSDGTEFISYIKKTDARRNQSFMSTHKEIATAMGY